MEWEEARRERGVRLQRRRLPSPRVSAAARGRDQLAHTTMACSLPDAPPAPKNSHRLSARIPPTRPSPARCPSSTRSQLSSTRQGSLNVDRSLSTILRPMRAMERVFHSTRPLCCDTAVPLCTSSKISSLSSSVPESVLRSMLYAVFSFSAAPSSLDSRFVTTSSTSLPSTMSSTRWIERRASQFSSGMT